MNKLLVLISLTTGILLLLTGITLMSLYVWEAVLNRLGEADQSLVFWYLPIFMIGLVLFSGGSFLSIRMIKKLREKSHY